MEDDILHRGHDRSIFAGDVLVFENVGAYTLVLKPPFIQGNVPILAKRANSNEPEILRRAETLSDLLVSYVVDE
jgi:diaminopimelate decarboxylase